MACRDVTENKNRLEKIGIEFLENGYKIPFPEECVREIIIGHNYQLEWDFLHALMKKYPAIQSICKTSPMMPFDIALEQLKFKKY